MDHSERNLGKVCEEGPLLKVRAVVVHSKCVFEVHFYVVPTHTVEGSRPQPSDTKQQVQARE